ncbi:protein AGENET DOMAIN (AGD)-CONTAINING P1 [Gastrolobium bilobum]|uniref:protein AGENET DOMAIN (AGD)-CONTAINING P1 n=1 Tax=Gastrolobium bilobum TaxID=150636 RepID=UPI002AAF261A|nr:protein AGENET DOMAIN (AGD)-CONTAINING P1 [Gastrolobium bilobum]
MFHFHKGDTVEVTKPKTTTTTNFYYPATVVRPPSKRKNLVFLEYLTLFAPSEESQPPKHLRENVNVASVRPKLPHQLNSWFKVGDAVDAYRQTHNAWCPGTVSDILENSNYLVAFHDDDSAAVDHCNLRLHRNWVHGNWVPPLPDKEQHPVMVTEPENLRFKIKYSRKPLKESKFKKGETVEVRSDDEGYKGAWFIATVVDIIGKDRFLVEYRDLTTDDGTQDLKEETHARFIRPCPSQLAFVASFKQFQEVDAWYNDGWWEGVVLQVLNSRECFVSFIDNDVLRCENSKLRPHQDWVNGRWDMPSKKSSELTKKFGDVMSKAKNITGNKLIFKCQKPCELAKKPTDVMSRTTNTGSKFVLHFCKGAKVEVRSDEEGYQGAWYTALIVNSLQNGKYLVEYLTLKTDDLTEQLKEAADASDIRPYPPDINHRHHFTPREWVDAWYNDGWWVGQVSTVLRGFKYRVYFSTTKEELEFDHCHLRPHQEWIDGRWVLASSG